jgi:hypothetical protein
VAAGGSAGGDEFSPAVLIGAGGGGGTDVSVVGAGFMCGAIPAEGALWITGGGGTVRIPERLGSSTSGSSAPRDGRALRIAPDISGGGIIDDVVVGLPAVPAGAGMPAGPDGAAPIGGGVTGAEKPTGCVELGVVVLAPGRVDERPKSPLIVGARLSGSASPFRGAVANPCTPGVGGVVLRENIGGVS